jgi:hypothetical protein
VGDRLPATQNSGRRIYAELAQYIYPKRKAVELAGDPVAPLQSKLVVEFVRARSTTGEDTDASTNGAKL